MLNRKQSLSRIIGATGISIFSLFAAFFGTYAWFTSLRLSQEEADAFVLVKTNYVKELNIYQQDSDNTSAYVFDETPLATYSVDDDLNLVAEKTPTHSITSDKSTTRSAIGLGTYDPLYNKQSTLLFEFTLDCSSIDKNSRTELYFDSKTNTTEDHSLVALNDDKTVKNKLTTTTDGSIPESNTMSSVIEFRQVSRTTTTDRFDFSSDISSSTAKPFVSISSGTITYQNSLSFSVSTASLPDSGDVYISMILEYNVDVMEYVLNLNSDFDISMGSGDQQYSFWQDWVLEAR